MVLVKLGVSLTTLPKAIFYAFELFLLMLPLLLGLSALNMASVDFLLRGELIVKL
jgi:hypothetical protein